MRGLAEIAPTSGDGDIRLTVWQNLLISGVPDDKVAAVKAAIEALGLTIAATPIRAGLVACTGATGCRFAAAHTKEHAEEIAHMVRGARRARSAGEHSSHRLSSFLRAALHRRHRPDRPARSTSTTMADPVEGYHFYVGGGFGPECQARPRDLSRR